MALALPDRWAGLLWARAGLKITLCGQDQERGRSDQEQIVRRIGSPAGISCPFAAPAAVVAWPPSPTRSPSRSGRPAYSGCPVRAGPLLAAVDGAPSPAPRVRAKSPLPFPGGSIWSGLTGLALIGNPQAAGEGRKMRRGALEFAGRSSGADRRDHQQQAADGAKRPKQPVVDFHPAKQRGRADNRAAIRKMPAAANSPAATA